MQSLFFCHFLPGNFHFWIFLTDVTQFDATTVESPRLLLPAERGVDDKTKIEETG
jgi:hypothetical protein